MKIKFTQKRIMTLKPKDKDTIVWDKSTPHFAVRVRSSGSKRYMHIYNNPRTGKQEKITIGAPELMTLDEALAKAGEITARINSGKNTAPVVAKSASPHIPSFEDFANNQWMQHSAQYNKPRTLKRHRVALEKQLIPAFGKMPLDKITRTKILQWFEKYSRTYPGGANRTLEILGAAMNHAVKKGLIRINPARGIPMNPAVKKTRFLSDEERDRLLAELDSVEPHNEQNADAVRLLLFTGCRLGEVLGLRWPEIRDGKLHLTDSKTGPRKVWLSEEAHGVIEARRQYQQAEYGRLMPFVFPSPHNPMRALKGMTRFWHGLRARIGLDDVRLHDLRHSFATQAVRLGVQLPVVSKLLGHSNLAMTMRYVHVGDTDAENAAERIGVRIAEALEGGELTEGLPR